MKKIFTLIAVAFMALSANAKYQLDLSDLVSGWGATYDAATKTISYEAGAWGGKGWMFTGFDGETKKAVDPFDFSAYDYVVIEIEESSLKANLVAEYTDGETLNDEGNGLKSIGSSNKAEDPNTTLLAVALDKSQKYLLQIYIQNQTWQSATPNNPSGTITLVDAYLATEAEYQAAKDADAKKEKTNVLEESTTQELAAGAYGWYGTWRGLNVENYNTLVFEIASVSAPCKVSVQGTENAEVQFEPSTEPRVYTLDISSWTTLGQYAYQNLNKPDDTETQQYTEADIKATTIVVTRVYLTNKSESEIASGIQGPTSVKVQSNAIYNLAGQKVNAQYKGVVIKNGKKIMQ